MAPMILIALIVLNSACVHAPRKRPWGGSYRNGKYQMTIDAWDSGGIAVNITRANDPKWLDKFLASVEGDVAKHSDFHEPERCWIEFRREEEGIRVTDHCKGPPEESGLYRREPGRSASPSVTK